MLHCCWKTRDVFQVIISGILWVKDDEGNPSNLIVMHHGRDCTNLETR